MLNRVWKGITFTFSTIKSMPYIGLRASGIVLLNAIGLGTSIGLGYFLSLSEHEPTKPTKVDINLILYTVFGITLFTSLEPVLESLKNVLLLSVKRYIASSITNKIANQALDLPLDYSNSNPTGSLSQIVGKTYLVSEKILGSLLGKIIPIFLEVVVLSGVGVYFFGAITLSLPAFFAIYAFAALLSSRKLILMQDKEFNKGYEFYGFFISLFSNYENVHYFGNKNYSLIRFKAMEDEFGKVIQDSSQATENYFLLNNIIIGSLFSSILILFGNEIYIEKSIYKGLIPYLMSYAYRFITMINKLPQAVNDLQTGFKNLENILEFLNKKTDIINIKNESDFILSQQSASVEFKEVSLKYNDKYIFNKLSFSVPPGQYYAIVGKSGVGKTTILKILFRFMEIDSGNVLIGGKNIRDITLKSLREKIAVVPQNPLLENISLEDNIRYGNFEASNISILTAIITAGLENLDLNKLCGERGSKLSGGQKQRVAIARALIKKQAVIFFYDEATSALDPESEKEVQTVLDIVSKGRTTLVVTHRLYTVINADKILYLSNGEIAEQGTYEELMALPEGHFKKQMISQCSTIGVDVDQIKPKTSYNEASSSITKKKNDFLEDRVNVMKFLSKITFFHPENDLVTSPLLSESEDDDNFIRYNP